MRGGEGGQWKNRILRSIEWLKPGHCDLPFIFCLKLGQPGKESGHKQSLKLTFLSIRCRYYLNASTHLRTSFMVNSGEVFRCAMACLIPLKIVPSDVLKTNPLWTLSFFGELHVLNFIFQFWGSRGFSIHPSLILEPWLIFISNIIVGHKKSYIN